MAQVEVSGTAATVMLSNSIAIPEEVNVIFVKLPPASKKLIIFRPTQTLISYKNIGIEELSAREGCATLGIRQRDRVVSIYSQYDFST